MKPVTLNLASRPFRNNTIVGSILVAATLALIAATVYNLYIYLNYGNSYAELQREERDDATRLTALEAEEKTLLQEIKKRDFRRVRDEGKFANDLILKRGFSWTLLFNTLESIMPPDVMMRSIRPNVSAEGITIRVDGVGKSHLSSLELENKLMQHPAFAHVYPMSERRLNPARPEIDFAMRFDYLPERTAPKDLVARAETGREPAPPPAAGSGASGGAGAPAQEAGTTAPAGTPAPAAAAEARGPARATPGTSVGRDGKPRTSESLARRMVAPGGIYPAVPAQADLARRAGAAAVAPSRRKASAEERKRATPAPGAPRGAHAAPAKPPARPPAPAFQGPAPRPATQPPVRSSGGTPPGDPNRPWTLSPGRQAAQAAQEAAAARAAASRPPVPAERVDLPLTFVSQPVGVVYAALARAHGVQIDLDNGVDRSAKVTANLKGKPLNEAILMVAGLAGHHVKRRGDGIYRVLSSSGAAPIVDPSLQEEDLIPAGAKR